MKHPVWDRILILLCALIALGCAAGVVALLIGKISFDMITGWIASVDMSRFVVKAAMAGIAALFVLVFSVSRKQPERGQVQTPAGKRKLRKRTSRRSKRRQLKMTIRPMCRSWIQIPRKKPWRRQPRRTTANQRTPHLS